MKCYNKFINVSSIISSLNREYTDLLIWSVLIIILYFHVCWTFKVYMPLHVLLLFHDIRHYPIFSPTFQMVTAKVLMHVVRCVCCSIIWMSDPLIQEYWLRNVQYITSWYTLLIACIKSSWQSCTGTQYHKFRRSMEHGHYRKNCREEVAHVIVIAFRHTYCFTIHLSPLFVFTHFTCFSCMYLH